MRTFSTLVVPATQGERARRSPGREGPRMWDRCAGRPPGRDVITGRREGDRLSRRRGLGATTRRVEVGLTPEAVEQVAQRVAQLLRAEPAPEQRPLTAGQLAHHLGVERSWVYKHTHLLGGERIGDGPRAQWRFELEVAKAALARQRLRDVAGTGA
jgi:hypothetical protein